MWCVRATSSRQTNQSVIIVRSDPGLSPHSSLSQQPHREADSSINGSHLLLLVHRNFVSSANISSAHTARTGIGHGSFLGAGGIVGPSRHTPPTDPSATLGSAGPAWLLAARRGLAGAACQPPSGAEGGAERAGERPNFQETVRRCHKELEASGLERGCPRVLFQSSGD